MAFSSDNSKYHPLARSVGNTGTHLDIVGTRISREILWSEELYASMLVNFKICIDFVNSSPLSDTDTNTNNQY